jgi:hypothetical protein
MSCEETREHLESCEECRLHLAVEARLRTQPVLEPPAGFAARVMKALPRALPVRREVLRLVAAAAILVALVSGVILGGLDRHRTVVTVKERTAHTLQAAMTSLSSWRIER